MATDGFVPFRMHNSIITGNYFKSVSQMQECNSNSFKYNTFERGVTLFSVYRNIFTFNNVTNTDSKDPGISLRSNSSYNRIYHNNFINNYGGGQLGYDEVGTNFWNSSYPFGGNYWSIWTYPDIKSGPNQDISGSDGIVDNPYVLLGGKGATDHYPLVNPINNAGSTVPEFTISPATIILSIILLTSVVVYTRIRQD
jgi:nitrous oxidase accessory protein NosD